MRLPGACALEIIEEGEGMRHDGYIGLDVGTSGCKACAVDEKGNILACARSKYKLYCPEKGIVELDPLVVWASVKAVLSQIAKADADLKMIAVSSIGEAIVMLDKKDNVIRNGITYLDERGMDTCNVIERKMSRKRMKEITGLPMRFFYSLNRLMWLQKYEPENIERADKYFLFGDYITYMLSGERVIDVSSASKTYMLDVVKRTWSEEIGASFDIPLSRFSRLENTGTKVGKIRRALAEEIGLPADLVVVVGSHDQCASALGSGAVETGDIAAGEGSTESLNLIVDQKYIMDQFHVRNLCCEPYVQPGQFLIPVGQHTHGTSIRWFVERFGMEDGAGLLPGKDGSDSQNFYEMVEKNCTSGSDSLFFVPHLTSAHLMDPDNASLGAFIGLEMSTDKSKMYRAVLEGLCFETRICFDMIRELGFPVNKIVASGGCSKSELLMQMKADVLETPVDILENPDAGISALAMICAVADGKYSSYKEASRYFVKTVKRYFPVRNYREKYREYMLVYNTMKEMYSRI